MTYPHRSGWSTAQADALAAEENERGKRVVVVVDEAHLLAADQRIALRYAMAPMTPAETTAYIAHHLNLAGRADTLFSDDAVALIHRVSRGLPRAFVDESSARAAVTEITAE